MCILYDYYYCAYCGSAPTYRNVNQFYNVRCAAAATAAACTYRFAAGRCETAPQMHRNTQTRKSNHCRRTFATKWFRDGAAACWVNESQLHRARTWPKCEFFFGRSQIIFRSTRVSRITYFWNYDIFNRLTGCFREVARSNKGNMICKMTESFTDSNSIRIRKSASQSERKSSKWKWKNKSSGSRSFRRHHRQPDDTHQIFEQFAMPFHVCFVLSYFWKKNILQNLYADRKWKA